MERAAFALHPIDIGILALYGVIMVAVGLYFGRRHDTAVDYFLAGRTMIWPVIGISLFASNISSTTLVGLAGDAYTTGISVFNYEWMAAFVLVFAVFFLFPLLLRAGIYTLPEFLERRYDARARNYFSVLTLFLNIVVDTAGSLYAGALIFKLLFPELPIWQTVAMLAVAAGLYTIVGGLSAVMYTDAIQAILLLFGSVLITWLALDQVGGWTAAMSAVSPEMLSLIRPLDDPGVPWLGLITGVPLLGFYFWCTNQFMAQRVLSAKTLAHGRGGALFAAALKLPVLFIMVLPGTIAISLYPGLERPDLVYPTLVFDLLPTGLLGLVLAGFIAALMSQIDSTLNSASTLVTMDFVRKAKPELTPHQLMRAGQVITFIFMLLAVLWAPQIENFGSLFKYLQRVLSYAVPPVVAMFLIGIFWRRATAHAAFVTLLVGVLAGALLFLLIEILGWVTLHFLLIAPVLFLLCLVVLIGVSLVTPAPEYQRIERYMWTPRFYHEETAELRNVPWYRNYRVLSAILILMTLALVWSFR